MLTNAVQKHWSPRPSAVSYALRLAGESGHILEIGPGHVPFPKASHFVDWKTGPNIVACDLNQDRLPFADKEFDFVYCRHVLEDLYNPFLTCREMSRVARAGYIETPSPIAEICRGVDADSPEWRGYHHHRYMIWPSNGALHFLTKHPIIERITIDEEFEAESLLRSCDLAWNSYFTWSDEIHFVHAQHDVDFKIPLQYKSVVGAAVRESIVQTRSFAQRL